MVLKPSDQTPLTALYLAPLLAELFPPGVVNIINGRGETVGTPLVSDSRVAMISLTGSVATGEKILQAAATGTRRTHLELGGKAPVIVFDDADIAEVVSGVRTFGYYNAGQDCTAACRIYAGAKVYDKLVADLSSAVSTIRMGTQESAGVEMGPLISAAQRKRVADLSSAPPDRGTSRLRRAASPGHLVVFSSNPQLWPGATQNDEIVRREVFGPRGVGHALQGPRRCHRLGQ